ncbi:MAG: hypothetical protein AAF587_35170 [Bacteroidota bacterium]
MSKTIPFKNFTRNEKVFFIGLLVWILLQISRLVAIPLIDDINAGSESAAWLYPAYLDLFAAVFALPLIGALLRWPGLISWTSAIVYLAISIVDHFGNFVTVGAAGPPSIVDEGMNPFLAPAIMTAIDAFFLILLLVPGYRRLFFKLTGEESK